MQIPSINNSNGSSSNNSIFYHKLKIRAEINRINLTITTLISTLNDKTTDKNIGGNLISTIITLHNLYSESLVYK